MTTVCWTPSSLTSIACDCCRLSEMHYWDISYFLQELANCQTVILSVGDEIGQRVILEDLLEATRNSDVGMRKAAATILNIYCSKTKADYCGHVKNLMSGLIRLLNDSDETVLNESWDALNAITKVLYLCTWMIGCPAESYVS